MARCVKLDYNNSSSFTAMFFHFVDLVAIGTLGFGIIMLVKAKIHMREHVQMVNDNWLLCKVLCPLSPSISSAKSAKLGMECWRCWVTWGCGPQLGCAHVVPHTCGGTTLALWGPICEEAIWEMLYDEIYESPNLTYR